MDRLHDEDEWPWCFLAADLKMDDLGALLVHVWIKVSMGHDTRFSMRNFFIMVRVCERL